MPMLQVDSAEVTIGSISALRGFSLSLHEGEMISLTGRNGAGKTTFMRSIMGLTTLRGGSIRFDGMDVANFPVHRRAALGIGYMPEDRRLIPELTVEENVLLPSWVTRELEGAERLEVVYEMMPELADMRDRRALLLSGGQQKLVALGRALAAGTRMLLLDEPFEGVAPALRQRLSDVIASLKGHRLGVILSLSELDHSFEHFDNDFIIERGANVAINQAKS